METGSREAGEALLAGVIGAELGIIAKAAIDLSTGSGSAREKEYAYERISSSSLTLGITGVMTILGEKASELAKAVIEGAKGFFRGEAPEVPVNFEAPTAEAPTAEAPTAEAPTAEAPTEPALEEQVLAEEPTPDGEHIRVTEDEVFICSECKLIEEKYEEELAADPDIAEDLREAESNSDPAERTKIIAGEILEEFSEAQERYGNTQQEVPTDAERGAADFDEPGRISELDPGYDPNGKPEGQHRFPTKNKGEWIEGGPGDGRWQPNDPGAYGLEPGQSVPFREGVPDFTEYAVETPSGQPGTFEVEGLTGNGPQDYATAVQELAAREGMTFEECQQWLSEKDLRLHHFSGNEMQIVPERLHGALGHQGSAVELRP